MAEDRSGLSGPTSAGLPHRPVSPRQGNIMNINKKPWSDPTICRPIRNREYIHSAYDTLLPRLHAAGWTPHQIDTRLSTLFAFDARRTSIAILGYSRARHTGKYYGFGISRLLLEEWVSGAEALYVFLLCGGPEKVLVIPGPCLLQCHAGSPTFGTIMEQDPCLRRRWDVGDKALGQTALRGNPVPQLLPRPKLAAALLAHRKERSAKSCPANRPTRTASPQIARRPHQEGRQ